MKSVYKLSMALVAVCLIGAMAERSRGCDIRCDLDPLA